MTSWMLQHGFPISWIIISSLKQGITLPETNNNFTPETRPKLPPISESLHLPTIDFQGVKLAVVVSGRENFSNRPLHVLLQADSPQGCQPLWQGRFHSLRTANLWFTCEKWWVSNSDSQRQEFPERRNAMKRKSHKFITKKDSQTHWLKPSNFGVYHH